MKKMVFTLLAIAVSALLASCAGAPKEAPADPSALPDFVVTARTAANDSRQKALAVKAEVASAELFTEAATRYTQAEEAEKTQAWDAAAQAYTASADGFEIARADAQKKRDAALAAMQRATEEKDTTEKILSEAEATEKEAQEGGAQ